LSYLQRLPVDTIKIDRSFVQRIDTNPVDAAIVSAIVAMAHDLQMRVVAEGVETSSQLQVLARLGCEMAQGFFFARPTTAADCTAMLDRTEQPRAVAGLRG
jgi:EAL domain-containing protein (putative c-di-GMP-specific phosphodiesterase class I)